MAKPQPNPPPPEDLDSRVDALLKDIHDTADRVEGTLAPDPALPSPANPAVSPTVVATGGSAEALSDLDSQIASLLRSAESETSSSDAPAIPGQSVNAADNEQEIGTLDADLARLTDSILKNNAPLPEIGPERTPIGREPAGKQGHSARNELPVAPGDDELLSAPAVKQGEAPAAEHGRGRLETALPSAVGPDSAPRSLSLVGSLAPGVVRIGASVGRAAAPAVLTAMAAASAPLAGRSRVVRDTIGWLALWTAFVSVSLWTYLLFFHKPEVPRTDSAPIEFVGQSGKAKPAHGVASAPTGEHTQSDAAPAKGGH